MIRSTSNKVRFHVRFRGTCFALIAATLTSCGGLADRRDKPAAGAMAPILLFDGAGASAGDVASVKKILDDNRLHYSTVNTSRLNQMSQSQMQEYRLLIVAGGNYIEIGRGLSASATTNVRNAVRGGMHYFGICAGAFFAGNSGFNGLDLTEGVRFRFYSAADRGIRKAAVAIAVDGAPTLEHYWEDGPQLTGWGAVVGKYPDGTPAIVEGAFGNGWVILTGVHTEAPESWRRGMTFKTPASTGNAYAGKLIRAALDHTPLSHR